MDKIQELLKVLDISEEEQKDAILDLVNEETAVWLIDYDMHLADLAFRLRDEVNKVEFHHCIAKVAKHINPHVIHYAEFALCTMQPIHWIIAALIAKEIDSGTDKKPATQG